MENDYLLEEYCKGILEKFKDKSNINNIGLWCFKYVIAKRCLTTWNFIPINSEIIDNSNKKLIDDAEIPEGVGSIGYMMLEKRGLIIKDTFEDPRGTVSQTDKLIDQKSALCYPIMDDKERIVIGLDFFSSTTNYFDDNHLLLLKSLIDDYKKPLINLYNYSQDNDILDLYNQEIKIPKRENSESFDDFTERIYREFLLIFLDITRSVARIPLVELLKKTDKNNCQVVALLFDPNEVKKILLQELLLCNYKAKWANDCPIIKGTEEAINCECCQQPMENLLEYLDIKKNKKTKPVCEENNFYKFLIFPDKEKVDSTYFFKEIKKIFNSYDNDIYNSSPKDMKIKLDELKNNLDGRFKKESIKNFVNKNIKLALFFLKYKTTFRWLKDIRTNENLINIWKDPIYLNPSTIHCLKSSLHDISVLGKYPPNIQSHSDVDKISVDKNTFIHTIELKNRNIASIEWEEKNNYKDLFYTYINDEWVKKIILNKIPEPKTINAFKKYLNLNQENNKKVKKLDLDEFTILNIYSPFPDEIEEIWPKLKKYITNLYSFYEASILKEKAIKYSMRSAIAAIMSRNMSHNIGSHVLANYSQEKYSGKTVNNIDINKIFNSYIQQRMDFIAGFISGWHGVPEEIWFLKDLIFGFLKNIPLLDLIVGSHNLNSSNIIFKIKANGTDYELRINRENDNRFVINNSKPDENDFLVGIPRGIIGNHAFYIILENMIRNSAKYGLNRKKINLEVTISCELNEEKGVYNVEIYDNLSLAKNKERNIIKEIQEKIDKDILAPQTGEPNYEDMGIAEMKESARMLIDPYKKNKDSIINGNDALRVGKAKCNFLKYMFHLMIPRLMTVISSKKYDVPLSEGILYKKNADIFLSSAYNSFLFIISKKKNIPSNIKRWNFPYHRLEFEENNTFDMSNWKELFLEKYYTWIKESLLKEKNIKYNLIISFAREKEASRWNTIKIPKFDNLGIHIVWTTKEHDNFCFKNLINSCVYNNNEEFLNDVKSNKLIIIYDNHENFTGFIKSPKINKNPLFSHKLGSGHEKIFGLLDNPPTDPFLLKYLLLNLWETAITKIMIIDERIAESYLTVKLKKEIIDVDKVKDDEQYLKITPIFYIEINNQKYFVSKKVQSAFKKTPKEKSNQLAGLKLIEKNWEIINGINKKYEICVIHQGVVDECIVPNIKNENWFNGYENIFNHFVVTSGRGKFIKHLPKDLAFIEFSVLKETLLNDRSKLHLFKALSMTKGGNDVR